MDSEKGVLQTIIDMIMGGKNTKPLRTPGPMDSRAQSNDMVKAAAEEARKRAVERGQIAEPLDPNAAAIMRKKQ